MLLEFTDNTELLHRYVSVTADELWTAKEEYRNARLAVIGDEDGEGQGGSRHTPDEMRGT